MEPMRSTERNLTACANCGNETETPAIEGWARYGELWQCPDCKHLALPKPRCICCGGPVEAPPKPPDRPSVAPAPRIDFAAELVARLKRQRPTRK